MTEAQAPLPHQRNWDALRQALATERARANELTQELLDAHNRYAAERAAHEKTKTWWKACLDQKLAEHLAHEEEIKAERAAREEAERQRDVAGKAALVGHTKLDEALADLAEARETINEGDELNFARWNELQEALVAKERAETELEAANDALQIYKEGKTGLHYRRALQAEAEVARLTAALEQAEREWQRKYGIWAAECDRIAGERDEAIAAKEQAEAAKPSYMASNPWSIAAYERMCVQVAEALAARERAEAERDDALAAQKRAEAERDEWQELYRSGAAVWNPTYEKVLNERNALADALAGAREEADKLWRALFWIDNSDPEITAAADTKFGLDMEGYIRALSRPTAEPAKAEEKR